MDLGETVSETDTLSEKDKIFVAGIGCRKDTSAEIVLSVMAEALKTVGQESRQPKMLATGPIKANEPGIIEAAKQLGIPLIIVEQTALEAAAPRTLTVSEVSLAYAGTPSLCEAAALAAAGETAKLVAPRFVSDGVTCAIAILNTET